MPTYRIVMSRVQTFPQMDIDASSVKRAEKDVIDIVEDGLCEAETENWQIDSIELLQEAA